MILNSWFLLLPICQKSIKVIPTILYSWIDKLLHMFVLTKLKFQDLRVNYIYGESSVEDKLLLNPHPMIVSFIITEWHKLQCHIQQMMGRIEVARNTPIRKTLVSQVIKLVGCLLVCSSVDLMNITFIKECINLAG